MSLEIFKRLGLFILLGAVQVLILNHIHLFGVATPLLYIYFTITFKRNTPKWALLLWSFAMGLTIDVFSNTPGLTAGSLTLVAFIQPYLLELLVPRDSFEELESSAKTLGFGKFSMLAGVLTLILCLVIFALDAFSFFNWLRWLECAASSTGLTLILILAIESVRSR